MPAVTPDQERGLAVARRLVAWGVPVFAAPPDPTKETGFRLPIAWHTQRPRPEQIERWQPGWALCAVMGHRIDLLDVDPRNGGDRTRAGLVAAGMWPTVYGLALTPSGGTHEFVAAMHVGSRDAVRDGLDVKGGMPGGTSRGFAFIAPTVKLSKVTGELGVYSWKVEPDLEALAEGGDDSGAAFAEMVRSAKGRKVSPDQPGTARERPDWSHGPIPDGKRYPHLRSHAGFMRDHGYHLDDARVVLRARWQACAQPPDARHPMPWEDAEALLEDIYTRYAVGEAYAYAAVTVGTAEEEDWPDPEPLAVAPAPVDVTALPPVLREMVTNVAISVQTPIEVLLVFALGVLSAATRGCWDVHVTDAWDAGPTALYGVTLADSGERKSGGARPLLRALNAAERVLVRQVVTENRARKFHREAAEARLKQAGKDGDQDGADAAAAVVHQKRARPVPALVLSDTTTEALGVHMEDQGGAVAMFNTEATSFATVAGYYSDKGGNLGLLNHAYDAEQFADKRIKRTGVTIPRPFLSWAAAVQTAVLTGYANGTTEGSGFLARFVLLLPASMVGGRTVRTAAVPADVQARWDSAVTELHRRAWKHYAEMADDPEDYGEPLTLTLTTDAASELLDYAQRLEDAKANDWTLRDLGGWIEKHPARLARIAALFALLDNPYALEVERRHLDAALSLGDALVSHATATMRVLRNVGSTGPVLACANSLC